MAIDTVGKMSFLTCYRIASQLYSSIVYRYDIYFKLRRGKIYKNVNFSTSFCFWIFLAEKRDNYRGLIIPREALYQLAWYICCCCKGQLYQLLLHAACLGALGIYAKACQAYYTIKLHCHIFAHSAKKPIHNIHPQTIN